MLAGHLQPSNAEIWCQLAEVELQENQVSAAVSCYNRAIHADPKDVDLHMKRLKLIQEKCMFVYNIYVQYLFIIFLDPSRSKSVPQLKLYLARALPKSKHVQILKICSEVAKEYFGAKNYLRAIEALKICIRRIPEKTNQDVLNMMLELLLLSERY